MEALAALEPQLLIPVVLVVIGAVLVYLFGFKPTEEPTLEHLAVLHQQPSKKGAKVPAPSKPQVKAKANGVANGVAKKGMNGTIPHKEAKATSSAAVVTQRKRENMKDPANKPEDFESGDWIPAVTRKEKSKKKDSPPSPKKGSPVKEVQSQQEQEAQVETKSAPAKKEAEPVTKGKVKETKEEAPSVVAAATAASAGTGKAPKIEDLLAELKEKGTVTIGRGGGGKKEEAEKVDIKANIAFDEMGAGVDSWEEAKSRGAKKRKTRKD